MARWGDDDQRRGGTREPAAALGHAMREPPTGEGRGTTAERAGPTGRCAAAESCVTAEKVQEEGGERRSSSEEKKEKERRGGEEKDDARGRRGGAAAMPGREPAHGDQAAG